MIAGPTGSGKTSLALELAELGGGEIVSADSQQVYQHFDIGTAKPSPEELGRVPHHLISVAAPHQGFSAARFQALADEAISGIAARGRLPLVAGGTGLYLRVLLRGVVEAPPASPTLRAALEEEALLHGREALHRRLAEVDPRSAAQVKPADLVRVVRALEIFGLTGTTASQLRERHSFAQTRYPFSLYVLDPPRASLYRRIDARTRAMFEGGLLDEVRQLLEQGFKEAPAMRSVGYAQALAHLEGRLSLEEAVARAAQETRRYAKRQLTWFRKEPQAVFLSPPYEPALLLAQARAGIP